MLDVKLATLLGQPEVSVFLRGIVARGRYANAYLLHGPHGVGKCTAALAFARAALCERVAGAAPAESEPSLFGGDSASAATGHGDDSCGECRGCRLSQTLQHPDLRLVFPLSGEEKTLEDTVIETYEQLREDPLFVFQYEKAASIRISQTRKLLEELAYRPHTASRRVVVVRDCDRMREDQFSALLKSVEEPGASTIWVLTTSRLARVPVTIRSRCQRVRFAPLSEALIRDVLRGPAEVSPDEKVRMLAALASGSLARALAMRNDEVGLKEQRDAALALLEPALAGDATRLWSAVQKLTAFGRTGREKLKLTLEFLQLWIRDILRLRHGAPAESIVNRDRIKVLQPLASQLDAAELRRRLLVLEEAIRAIDGNISSDLALFSALARVGGSRAGEGAWPAHATARWDV
jgi:DNA polymerase-3 subunit delta'